MQVDLTGGRKTGRTAAFMAELLGDRDRLPLYELDHSEPIGYVERDGSLTLPERHPGVLFADTQAHVHFSSKLTISPFDSSSDATGPGPHGIDAPLP